MHINDTRCPSDEAGFSLIELLTSVAIIGILTAIAVPTYTGYMDNTRTGVIKDQLRAIHLQQQEYYAMYNRYYATGETCTSDAKSSINATLFGGDNVLQASEASYCITQSANNVFLAQATYNSTSYTMDNQGNINF